MSWTGLSLPIVDTSSDTTVIMVSSIQWIDWVCWFFSSVLKCLCGFLAHMSSAQDELLWSLFVRRPSVCPSVFSSDFSSEAAEPILLKFHMAPS